MGTDPCFFHPQQHGSSTGEPSPTGFCPWAIAWNSPGASEGWGQNECILTRLHEVLHPGPQFSHSRKRRGAAHTDLPLLCGYPALRWICEYKLIFHIELVEHLGPQDYNTDTSTADSKDDDQIDDEEHLKLGCHNCLDPACWTQWGSVSSVDLFSADLQQWERVPSLHYKKLWKSLVKYGFSCYCSIAVSCPVHAWPLWAWMAFSKKPFWEN